MKITKYELERDFKEGIYFAQTDNSCPAHFHSKVEILYVSDGKKTVIINDKVFELSSDNIVLSLGYDVHQYLPSKDSTQIVLTLPTDMFYDYYERYTRYELDSPVITDAEFCKDIKPIIYRIIDTNTDNYVCSGYCTALLGTLTAKIGLKEKKSEQKQPLIKNILKYIEQNYKDNLTIGDLAKQFGFSRNYMSHLFNDKIGTGFCDYLNFVRLRNAVAEMKTGNSSITETCFNHGFGSLASFYRCFKSRYGVSPKKSF